jgi:hypothetical protein
VFKSHPRQSRTITGLALGLWLFALLVGIAHACNLGDLGVTRGQRAVMSVSAGSRDGGMLAGCEEFCASNVPVVTKLPLIGDQQEMQPQIVAVNEIHVVIAFPPAFQPAPVAHPPSDVPPFLRFTRLRL